MNEVGVIPAGIRERPRLWECEKIIVRRKCVISNCSNYERRVISVNLYKCRFLLL